MASRAELEQYATNPNVRIMLDTIARAEGTYGGRNSYAVYGGSIRNQLPNLNAHPGTSGSWGYQWNDGKKAQSTAAGRYQFVHGTWNGLAKKYGFEDFSPRNQDLAAIALIAERGALEDVAKGDFQSAMNKLGKTWASLPSSTYAQPKRSQAEFDKFLKQSGANPSQYGAGGSAQANGSIAGSSIGAYNAPKEVASATPPDTSAAGLGLNMFAPILNKDELAAIKPVEFMRFGKLEDFFTPTNGYARKR